MTKLLLVVLDGVGAGLGIVGSKHKSSAPILSSTEAIYAVACCPVSIGNSRQCHSGMHRC